MEFDKAEDADIPPQHWRPLKRPDGSNTARVSCPDCGRSHILTDHDIGPNGDVTPSVVCSYPECDFHAFITLNGWKP